MSILRYPGGKTKAIKFLEKYLPDSNSYDTVISPFIGGASFELYIKDKYKKNIVANDKFIPLINFWIHASSNNSELADKIKSLIPVDKELFYKIRKELFQSEIDVLTKAAYYYIINRCSFSGTTCSGGFSEQASTKRLNLNSIDRLKKLNSQNIIFYNKDYKEFLDISMNKTTNLIFADPPYYLGSNSKLYGKNGDLHESFNHEDFYKIIIKFNLFMICYNDCEYIRNLYKNYTIIDLSWNYGMNKTKKSSEILILSYTI